MQWPLVILLVMAQLYHQLKSFPGNRIITADTTVMTSILRLTEHTDQIKQQLSNNVKSM